MKPTNADKTGSKTNNRSTVDNDNNSSSGRHYNYASERPGRTTTSWQALPS
jgi:hypothetical protein